MEVGRSAICFMACPPADGLSLELSGLVAHSSLERIGADLASGHRVPNLAETRLNLPVPRAQSRARRRRRALRITETELRLMAAPAMTGLSSAPKNG